MIGGIELRSNEGTNGIAIRQNVNAIDGMMNAVHAALFHVASSAKNNWHDHCPAGVSTWCRYNFDRENLTSTNQLIPFC